MSGPAAGTGKSVPMSRTRSGPPSRVQSSGNLRGEGESAGFPSGAPDSAQAESVAMSCSESDRSCLNGPPMSRAAFHGGIDRSSTTAAISSAPLSRLGVGIEGERPHLPLAMALQAVPLKDPERPPCSRWESTALVFSSGSGQPTTATNGSLHLVSLEDRRDGVLEFVARGVCISDPALGELVVDPPVVAEPVRAHRSRTPRAPSWRRASGRRSRDGPGPPGT